MEGIVLYILLETINKICKKRRVCHGCVFHDINYGCLINTRPDMWNTDIIKKNIDIQNFVD